MPRRLIVVFAMTCAMLTPGCGGEKGQEARYRREPAVVAVDAGLAETHAGGIDYGKEVTALETVMDQCFRRDPVEASNTAISNAVAQHNAWVEQNHERIESAQDEMKRRADAIDDLKTQIESMDKQLTNGDARTDPTYAALTARRNQAVDAYNEGCEQYNADAKTRRQAVDTCKAESDRQKAQIAEGRQRIESELAEYKRWRETRQDLAFYQAVNRLYGQLAEMQQAGENTPEAASCLASLRAMRAELGARAIKESDSREGVVLIRVELAGFAGAEECVMVVDTGAESVTIDPSVVHALGLHESLGDEVHAAAAGGLTTKGRKVTLPEITAAGHTARDVPGVALNAPDVGVDGLLGQSFLNRFVYRIDRKDPRKLVLRPLSEPGTE